MTVAYPVRQGHRPKLRSVILGVDNRTYGHLWCSWYGACGYVITAG